MRRLCCRLDTVLLVASVRRPLHRRPSAKAQDVRVGRRSLPGCWFFPAGRAGGRPGLKFADGRVDEAQKAIEQPITAGLLSGETVTMHLIDNAGNDTCPLLSINDLRRLRMVVDYEEGKRND